MQFYAISYAILFACFKFEYLYKIFIKFMTIKKYNNSYSFVISFHNVKICQLHMLLAITKV